MWTLLNCKVCLVLSGIISMFIKTQVSIPMEVYEEVKMSCWDEERQN